MIRVGKCLSQDNVAASMEVSAATVSLYERGAVNVSVESMCKLAEALEVQPEEILAVARNYAEEKRIATIVVRKPKEAA